MFHGSSLGRLFGCIIISEVFSCVVPGEKNSPTTAHAGHTRRRKWVPGAWGYSWVTLPWVL
jgi:hypothetical protein